MTVSLLQMGKLGLREVSTLQGHQLVRSRAGFKPCLADPNHQSELPDVISLLLTPNLEVQVLLKKGEVPETHQATLDV